MRHLVIARVCHPQSKVATVAYLKSYFDRNDRQRLIVSYSDVRAKKNVWNRNKGTERLRKTYEKGTLAKENVNK